MPLHNEYEQRGQELPLEIGHALRQAKAKPVLEKFKTWVDELLPGTPPNSALGEAVHVMTCTGTHRVKADSA